MIAFAIPTRSLWMAVATIVLLTLASRMSAADDREDYTRKLLESLKVKTDEWLKAGSPGESAAEGAALMDAAVHAGRADLAEAVLAEGGILKRIIRLPRGGRRVKLRVVHSFTGCHARLYDEMFSSIRSSQDGWLARRITAGAFEVWTPKHGWLFDRRGRLLHEARPLRGTGHGREWYGAFLPDGRWVTADEEEMDGVLRFFSAAGKPLRALICEELAPPPEGRVKLIGWARCDRSGKGWVVNVGSGEGYATVWVGPQGPARILRNEERWRLCYPRALGPRGMYLSMSVPDDSFRWEVSRSEAGHGPGIGFPEYSLGACGPSSGGSDSLHRVPNGNFVFGFWPGKRNWFVGSDGNCEEEARNMSEPGNAAHEASGLRTRKFLDGGSEPPEPIIDKTWFFDKSGSLQGWLRGRRLGDASDGRAMLFRVAADSRIATLGPDLRVLKMRRMVWKDGSIADAVTLWDDLGLGLFIRNGRMVLAAWGAQ